MLLTFRLAANSETPGTTKEKQKSIYDERDKFIRYNDIVMVPPITEWHSVST